MRWPRPAASPVSTRAGSSGLASTPPDQARFPSTPPTARLALSEKWIDDLSAQCWLWKDHTSWREAAKITEASAKLRPQYIAKCGGVYSSEWFWAKIWHCLNVAPETFAAAFSWVELADWAPSVLAGVSDPQAIKRGVCAAGHKALYSDEWGGLPDKEFLERARPASRRVAGPALRKGVRRDPARRLAVSGLGGQARARRQAFP